MRACVVQTPYSTDFSKIEEYIKWELNCFDSLDDSLDIVVFPESCDVACLASTREELEEASAKYAELISSKASETAKRISAIVIVNVHYASPDGEFSGRRNSTLVYDRQGRLAGRYDKQHLTPGETAVYGLDSDYTFEYNEPYVLEIEGVRLGFLTCYDFYFYESYAAIARKNVDILIGCSHQRSDTYEALEIINRHVAYHTNAYLIRSSVSMGDTGIGGCSSIVAPNGRVIVDMKGSVGTAVADIDPKAKYFKPAGFNNPPAAHYEYIEKGRRPWKYRPSGPSIVRNDNLMPYPRTCAHRGFNTIAPENSLPAFGAAISLGAEEIEFDLWETKDGEIVSIHDSKLDRVSDGTGYVWDYTYDELLAFDFGIKCGERFKGLRVVKFEEILKRFTCQTIMNIHIKTRNMADPYDEVAMKKIISLIREYDCEKYVYFMCGNDTVLRQFKACAPDLKICVGAGRDAWKIVDRAIELGAEKVQLFHGKFDRSMVEHAHENGIICNVFYADDEATCREYLEMGVDTILTNDYLSISQIVNEYKK